MSRRTTSSRFTEIDADFFAAPPFKVPPRPLVVPPHFSLQSIAPVIKVQFRLGINRTGAEPVLCSLSPEQGGRVIS